MYIYTLKVYEGGDCSITKIKINKTLKTKLYVYTVKRKERYRNKITK